MKPGIDPQFVHEHYQRMTDSELEYAATQNAQKLTPEAQAIVKNEIARRGMSTSLIKSVEAQNKELTLTDLDRYCETIRNLSCPTCGSSDSKLNGTMTSEVMSVIIFTQSKKKLKIGCPDCLDNAVRSASSGTALIGWWGIPWGIIRSVKALIHNGNVKKLHHIDSPNDYLRSFVYHNIGQIEMYRDNKAQLRRLLSNQNRQ
ncbi:hypothetical protein ACTHGU_05235 [Chitinophagaceae bacterium MMS25-I14]